MGTYIHTTWLWTDKAEHKVIATVQFSHCIMHMHGSTSNCGESQCTLHSSGIVCVGLEGEGGWGGWGEGVGARWRCSYDEKWVCSDNPHAHPPTPSPPLLGLPWRTSVRVNLWLADVSASLFNKAVWLVWAARCRHCVQASIHIHIHICTCMYMLWCMWETCALSIIAMLMVCKIVIPMQNFPVGNLILSTTNGRWGWT